MNKKSNVTDLHIFLSVDETLSKEWKGIKSLSYTMYKALLCPLKYYTSYIYKQPVVNHYIIKGIVVHQLYEEALKHLKQTGDIYYFNTITFDYIKDKIDKLINNYKDLDKSNITEDYVQNLVQEIKDSLNIRFINFIKAKLDNGYKLYIEQPNKNINEVTLFDKETDLYTKSDIILIKKDKIEIIDVKTGNIYPEYIEQVIFYLYSYLKYAETKDYNVNTVIGSIYSTKLNKYQILLYSNKDYIMKKFYSYIDKLKNIYKRLNINSIQDIRYFVECELTNRDDFLSYEFIKEYNNCNFCHVKNICPMYNSSNKVHLQNYIKNLSISEKIIYFEIPDKKKEKFDF